VYEETLTGQPHDTSVQKATSDNKNMDAVKRHALDVWVEAQGSLFSIFSRPNP